MEKHVIFGANGPIGSELADLLIKKNKHVVRVGRKASDDKHYKMCDALNLLDVMKVTKDATHIYVTIGLAYDTKVWKKIMANHY